MYETRTSEDLLLQTIDAHHGCETFLETIQNYVDDHGDVDAEEPDAYDVDDFIHVAEMLEDVAILVKNIRARQRRDGQAKTETADLLALFAE